MRGVLAMGAMAKDAMVMGVLAEEVVLAMDAMAKDAMAMDVLAEVVLAMDTLAKDAMANGRGARHRGRGKGNG